ncbi:MAG: hypothetical protein RL113_297 [Pseudomonadota bacterium]
MAKARANKPKEAKKKNPPDHFNPMRYASSFIKIKAFITDAFMLLTPIVYAVFYLVMDGREGFEAHKLMGWIFILIPLVIVQTLFFYFSGQTPGYRAYDITLVDIYTHKTPTLPIIIFRNLTTILSFLTFFGWVMMFFRKDHKTLHDLLSATAVVKK